MCYLLILHASVCSRSVKREITRQINNAYAWSSCYNNFTCTWQTWAEEGITLMALNLSNKVYEHILNFDDEVIKFRASLYTILKLIFL